MSALTRAIAATMAEEARIKALPRSIPRQEYLKSVNSYLGKLATNSPAAYDAAVDLRHDAGKASSARAKKTRLTARLSY